VVYRVIMAHAPRDDRPRPARGHRRRLDGGAIATLLATSWQRHQALRRLQAAAPLNAEPT
jgi:hypothetical protein